MPYDRSDLCLFRLFTGPVPFIFINISSFDNNRPHVCLTVYYVPWSLLMPGHWHGLAILDYNRMKKLKWLEGPHLAQKVVVAGIHKLDQAYPWFKSCLLLVYMLCHGCAKAKPSTIKFSNSLANIQLNRMG